jgi:hypothetical protein
MELNHIDSIGIESAGIESAGIESAEIESAGIKLIVCVGIGHGYAGGYAGYIAYAGEYAC